MPDSVKTRPVPHMPINIQGMNRNHFRNVNGRMVPILVRHSETGETRTTTWVDAKELCAVDPKWEMVPVDDSPEAA